LTSPTLLIAATEIRRQVRDRSALIRGVLAPFALAAIMGLAFGRTPASTYNVALVAPNPAAVRTVNGIHFVPVGDREAARQLVKKGKVAAALVLPASSADSAEVLEASQLPYAGRAVAAVARSMDSPSTRTTVDDRQAAAANPISYFGPAMAMLFLFFTVGSGARSIMAEGRLGTLARLRAAPISARAVLAGKVLATLLVCLASMLVLWLATSIVFGATWGPAGAVLLLCVGTVVAIAGLTSLVTALARNEAEAEGLTLMVGFGLALLGGNFFPPAALPSAFEKLSRLTPNGIALQAFAKLSIEGSALRAIVPSLVALAAFGAITGAIAVARLGREVEPA